MPRFFFKEFEVEHIIKPKLKNSYLSIDAQLHIVVKTPEISRDFVESLLLQKEQWLRKHATAKMENRPQEIQLTQEVLLFGEILNINNPKVRSLQKKLQSCKKHNILKVYDSFYKITAQDYLLPRVEYFAALMHLSFESIKYRKMKRRWGSCSSLKVLTFNTQLIKVKKELIDYVIVHELAHLKHMNHSKKFHLLVEQYLPNAKQLREALKHIQLNG